MPNPVLERYPHLRRITNTAPARYAVEVLRLLPLIRERAAFLAGEARTGTGTFSLASHDGHRVALRHRSQDLQVLSEIFRHRIYHPPPEAAGALARAAADGQLSVLDLGANVGLFAVDVLIRQRGARVVSYEADADNFAVLELCRSVNPKQAWETVHACAMAHDGTTPFAVGQFAHSHVGEGGSEVRSVDVLPLLRTYDFVKIDIEGSEWPIITDPRWPQAMSDTSVLVMEWHKRGSGAADAAEARRAAVAAVRSAGFATCDDGLGWDHGLIWAWRPANFSASSES